jgi:threonine dehydrogenase-like Zn-dependent dehydrogenase
MEIARPAGTVVLIALYEHPAQIAPTLAVQKELTVRGSAIFTPEEFREAIDLLATGQVRAQPLITHRLALEDLGEAFEIQLDKDAAIKVMVSPGSAFHAAAASAAAAAHRTA